MGFSTCSLRQNRRVDLLANGQVCWDKKVGRLKLHSESRSESRHDALYELADLSLALEKTNITLLVTNKLISRQVEVFTARKDYDKDYDSEYHSDACQAVASGTFKGVPVDTRAQKKIDT